MQKRTILLVLPVLAVIFIIGFYLRIVSVRETEVFAPLRADAGNYFMYAYNLRHKHVYSMEVGNPHDLESPVTPDAIRTPGYPLFLSLFVNGLPNKDMIDRIVFFQALISTLTLIIAFLFFKTYLSGFWSAFGALLVAFSPHLIVANSYVLTETLFCFLLMVFACLTSLIALKPSLWLASITGISIGLASLVRPSLQYFPFIMALVLVIRFGRPKGIRLAVFLLIGFVISFSPWIVRNCITIGAPADKRLSVNFLHHGIYPDFTYDDVKESHGFPYRYDPRADDIGRDMSSVIREIERRFSWETAKHLNWYVLKKPFAFWSWNMVQGAGDAFVYPVSKSPYFTDRFFRWTRRIMYHGHWPTVVLALFGCLLAWFPLSRLNMEEKAIFVARFVSILLAYFTFLHVVGAPFPRYSVPLRPFLYSMALFTPFLLMRAVRRYGRLQKSRRYHARDPIEPPLRKT